MTPKEFRFVVFVLIVINALGVGYFLAVLLDAWCLIYKLFIL